MKKRKILWQSSTVIARFPDYKEAILRHAGRVLGPRFEVEVRGVEKGTPDIHFMAFDFLNNYQVFQSVTRAEAEGCAGVAIGCFLDPVLDELREVMNIPVLSLAETGMLTACMLGKRFAVVSYIPECNAKRYAELVHKYALTERCAGLTSFNLPFEELDKGFKDPARVIEKFTAAGREAVGKGAEVLLPACGCLNLILTENGINQVDGATVLDVSGTLMKMIELMIVLRETSGTQVSRRGFYESPSRESVRQIVKNYLTP
ncbi:MAG: aspartate/glutamate racemase family protein [Thermodesulfobacteriota bacterium]